jgi:D-alanyl-D-alanine carboxypeptidase/D-alanyl-D-alanine-endopeptidase (penicillin-binding protein 4)
MVLKAIGAKVVGHGTTVAGADVVKRDLRRAHVPLAGVHIADGSGLSRDDRVTANELSAILVLLWNDPDMRPVVWNALPIAGESGTLQNRLGDNPSRALLRAKTGTTDLASALSGYIGHRYAFVTIENGNPVDYWAAHAAEDGVAEALIDQLHSS